ncbi:ankyrin repeat-containing domain protein [Tuber borchii]|uniref:Ankyrin repeat-containing domain protein n=1 Tax=Tuber borchii TaxID=42251 RepID=A0A2T7A3W7_TUBBO|nr:ankyrin repeat-containing domain protein [Tuber borchii]
MRGYEGIVKLLLDRKEVDTNSRDNDGRTPLLYAAEGGHEEIVKLLLHRNEVNPDSRNNSGQTPLLCAAEGGHEGIVKLLLGRNEVNPHSKENSGTTPLELATSGRHWGIVNLLQGRADAKSGTGANGTPMPPSHPLGNSCGGLEVSQPSRQPPGVAPNVPTQTTRAALLSAVSPVTPNNSSEIFSQAHPLHLPLDISNASSDISLVPSLDSPPLDPPNPGSWTAITAATTLVTVATNLTVTIKRWLRYSEDSC